MIIQLFQQIGPFDWDNFSNKFRNYVQKITTGKIQMKVKRYQRPGLSINYQFPDGSSCHFNDSAACSSCYYSLCHPNLVLETLIGAGHEDISKNLNPKVVVFNVCSATRFGDVNIVYSKHHTLLSITYIFRFTKTVQEVYRQIRTVGVILQDNSLNLSRDLIGTVALDYAKGFKNEVVDQQDFKFTP